MDTTPRIIQIIENSDLLVASDKERIEKEIQKYPFVQPFQYLLIKWKQKFSSGGPSQKDIEKLSVYTTHRELIKLMIDRASFQVIKEEIKESEKEPIFEKEDKIGKIEEEINKFDLISNNVDLVLEEEKDNRKEINENVKNFVLDEFNDKKENNKDKYIDKLGISYLFSNQNREISSETNDIETTIENKNEINESLKSTFVHDTQLVDYERDSTLEIGEESEGHEVANEDKNENIKEIQDNNLNNNIILTQNSSLEAKQSIITPVERLTFNQWLSSSNKRVSVIKEAEIVGIEKQQEIIDKFIQENPKIVPTKKENSKGQDIDFKKDEIKDIANLMTVTLAQLYIEQGKYDTAITAFKILSLKYPEKSSYFAAEIRKIKKIKNSK